MIETTAMIRAGCMDPEPYFRIPIIVAKWLWLLVGDFTLIFLTYVVIIYTVLRLKDKGSRKKNVFYLYFTYHCGFHLLRTQISIREATGLEDCVYTVCICTALLLRLYFRLL